jgi:dienelactone hydrolase
MNKPPMSTAIRRAALGAAMALAVLASHGAWAQRLTVSPATDVLIGTPLNITVSGLAAGAEVSVHSLRVLTGWTGQPSVYGAQARYRADAQGRVDLATAAPMEGSYQGADVQGLFWSAQLVPGPVPEGLARDQVRLSLRQGERVLHAVTLTLRRSHPAVELRPVAEFPGAVLASLPGVGPLPALIAMGGSEGGSHTAREAALRLASQGFAVLGLPYYSPSGWGPNGPTPPELPTLPQTFVNIPVDRLQTARDWLARQPGVDADRIGLYGVSKGAEFALLAASRMPWVRSVVAVVPTDVTWEGWGQDVPPGQSASFAWQGQPLPFVPYKGMAQEMAGFSTGGPVRFRRPHEAGRAAHPGAVAAARIPVERYAGALMVIGADNDQVWGSGPMARRIAAARQTAGLATDLLVYPTAGHALSGPGWSPTTGYNAGPMQMGGDPPANGRAVADAWPKTLDFLRRSLGPVPPLPAFDPETQPTR